MLPSSFLYRQKIYLKIIFVFLGFFILLSNTTIINGYLLILNFLFFFCLKPFPFTYQKTLFKLSVFWICYLLSGIIFSLPLTTQIDFLIKCFIMLQYSVFLYISTKIEHLVRDVPSLLSNQVGESIFYFLVMLNEIMKELSQQSVGPIKNALSTSAPKFLPIFEKIALHLKEFFDKELSESEQKAMITKYSNLAKINLISLPNSYLLFHLACTVALWKWGRA